MGNYAAFLEKSLAKNFPMTRCTALTGSALVWYSQLRGDFFDGVQFGITDFSLRVQLQGVLVGAMPIGAYQCIRNLLIRLTGSAKTLFARAV